MMDPLMMGPGSTMKPQSRTPMTVFIFLFAPSLLAAILAIVQKRVPFFAAKVAKLFARLSLLNAGSDLASDTMNVEFEDNAWH